MTVPFLRVHPTWDPLRAHPRFEGETGSKSLRGLFERARVLPPDEQEAFLKDACPDDPEAQAELVSLIGAAKEAEGFFDSLADAVLSLSPWSEADSSRCTTSSSADPMIGRTVRQYRIEERLGRGGMGVVYRAHDTSLNRAVALKFLPRHLTGDETATERLRVEAQAAAALDHPNICNVHEIGEDDNGRRFIAMAYYEGETLKRKLERGALPIDEAWGYAHQIAAGLGAAHAHDIVHRDIKPGNVIVMSDGLIKVLDFGLAKLTDVTLTVTGTTMGTVAYMSPEQAKGKAVDHRTDLWSLGAVLYEMLTGERPFRGEKTGAVIHAIVNEDPRPPSELRPEIPAGLETVVARLLAKDPGTRPTSAEASGLLLGEISLPGAVFAAPRTAPPLGSWRAVGAVVLVAATILVGRGLTRSSCSATGRIDSVAVLSPRDLTGGPA